MFAFKNFTETSSIGPEKGQIHSGMDLAEFAIKIPQKKTKHKNVPSCHVYRIHAQQHRSPAAANAEHCWNTRTRMRTAAQQQQQHSSSSNAATAAAAAGAGVEVAMTMARKMNCDTAARPGSITTISIRTASLFLFSRNKTQETPTAAVAQQPMHSSSSSNSGGGGGAAWLVVAVEASATELWYSGGG